MRVHEHGLSLGDGTHKTAGLEKQVRAEPVVYNNIVALGYVFASS